MKLLNAAILILLFLLPSALIAQSKKDTIPTFFGVSYIPAMKWKVFNLNNDDGKVLNYKFNVNSQSSVEGNFSFNKIGIRLGFSANIENNFIGKAYQYGGYIGIKSFWLRMQSSKVSGTAYWTGEPLPSGYMNEFNFSNKYFNIELLKTSKAYKHMAGGPSVNSMLGTYWGVGYTSMGFPIKISTLTTPGGRENQKFGKPAYDTLFTAKFYSACFGFDLLRQLCMTKGEFGSIPGKPAKRFGMYASTQDKIGFGPGKLSNYGVSLAETLNPGYTAVTSKFFSTIVHYSLSVGFRYLVKVRPVFLILAAGYDLEGASIINFGGAADTNTDLGFESSFFFINHGVSLKIYMSWIGNK
ncbi:MAG: hypothetical protein EHM93_01775 [Bacteroidales bacterium]|nr:MAG: hypothetical protein EHM93_01775 [Bacteroidales bacterium]